MKDHLKRLIWPIIFFAVSLLITLIVGISRTNLEVVVFKFLIFCPSVVLVHLARKTLFPYIDLEEFIHPWDRHESHATRDAAVILGVFLFYVVLIYALTQAI